MARIGCHDPCPCGSGKKSKRCACPSRRPGRSLRRRHRRRRREEQVDGFRRQARHHLGQHRLRPRRAPLRVTTVLHRDIGQRLVTILQSIEQHAMSSKYHWFSGGSEPAATHSRSRSQSGQQASTAAGSDRARWPAWEASPKGTRAKRGPWPRPGFAWAESKRANGSMRSGWWGDQWVDAGNRETARQRYRKALARATDPADREAIAERLADLDGD